MDNTWTSTEYPIEPTFIELERRIPNSNYSEGYTCRMFLCRLDEIKEIVGISNSDAVQVVLEDETITVSGSYNDLVRKLSAVGLVL